MYVSNVLKNTALRQHNFAFQTLRPTTLNADCFAFGVTGCLLADCSAFGVAGCLPCWLCAWPSQKLRSANPRSESLWQTIRKQSLLNSFNQTLICPFRSLCIAKQEQIIIPVCVLAVRPCRCVSCASHASQASLQLRIRRR